MTSVTEAFIRRMWAEGVPVPKIAQYLNWSPITVRRQAQQLGLPSRSVGRPRRQDNSGLMDGVAEARKHLADADVHIDAEAWLADESNDTESNQTQSET